MSDGMHAAWLSTAPSHFIRTAREAAAQALAAEVGVDLDAACELHQKASTAIRKLPVEDARWAAQLRWNRDTGDVLRGLSQRASRVFREAAHACSTGCADLAATVAKRDSPLFSAVKNQLENPIPES